MKYLFTLLFCCVGLLASAQEVEVTFQVDMTGIEVSADGVHIAGDLNGWSTDATPLTDTGNGIYAATVSLRAGRDIQYKFLNGNAWGVEETPPLTCAVNDNNRILTVPLEDVMLSAAPFNGCAADAGTKMVTFRVDMSGQTVGDNGVHVAGNFQNWKPGATRMNDAGNGVYEVTVPVLNTISVIQYKFINGNDWGTEEDPPAGCENFDNNRMAIATGTDDITLPTNTFAGCENPVPTKDVTFRVEMTGFEVSANGVHLAGDFQGWNPGGTPMTAVGDDIYEVTLSIPAAISSINYKFVNGNDWGMEEDPADDCANADNNRFAILPLTPAPITLQGVLFSTCEAITSIPELLVGNDFQLMPTVTNDFVTVRYELPTARSLNLRVIDFNGRILSEQILGTVDNGRMVLDVTNYPAGMYLVQLTDGRAASVRRLVKQ